MSHESKNTALLPGYDYGEALRFLQEVQDALHNRDCMSHSCESCAFSKNGRVLCRLIKIGVDIQELKENLQSEQYWEKTDNDNKTNSE